jgi:hypothetical protein
MRDWVPELTAFYAGPFIVACVYAVVTAALRAPRNRLLFALSTAAALLVMWTVVPSLSPKMVFLGMIPGLQSAMGTAGLAAAALVLFLRSRKVDHGSWLLDAALAVAAFLAIAGVPVLLFLLLMSMNPD